MKHTVPALIGLLFVATVVYSQGVPDPPMREVLAVLKQISKRPLPSLTPKEARIEPGSKDAFKELLRRKNNGVAPAPEAVARVEDRTLPAEARSRVVRIYTPQGKGAFPITVYVHGGGWTVGSIAGYDPAYRAIANLAQTVVVSVSYRLAPENKFPGGLEDVYAVFQYVAKHPEEFGGNGKTAIMGESAGGNLAAATTLLCRDRKGAMPVYQVLVYPITDTDTNTKSYRRYAKAAPLDKPQMQYFIRQVIRTQRDLDSPYLAPLRAPSLRGLPPATVITAEIDPLNTEGAAYAKRLALSGVPVRYHDYPGATHEFFSMGALIPDAKNANAFAADGLRKAFGKAN